MTSFQKKLLGGTLAAVILIVCCAAVLAGPRLVAEFRSRVAKPAAGDAPKAGTCWDAKPKAESGFPESYGSQARCGDVHLIETVYVAKRGSETDAGLVTSCVAELEKYLGGRYEASQLQLNIRTVAAWYSCDVAQSPSLEGSLTVRKGSLRGRFAEVALACGAGEYKGESITNMTFVSCQGDHDSEFAGLYTIAATNMPEDDAALEKAVFAGCSKTVAGYLGWTTAELERYEKLRYWYWGSDLENAKAGHRTYQCFASTFAGSTLTSSLRNIGRATLPIK
ncbi:septum formation family protein [Longispora albida]|uniref:septum formation family protein n=1 Tax=Longispora albida TaxID=203523 RepID=UPI0003793087|nr:septum formation family protein [Longispora albida]